MKKSPRSSFVGFTLIELMLVVAIIGLLAAIAIPKFADLVTKSKEASMRGKLNSLRSALSIYYCDMEGVHGGQYIWYLTIGGKYLDEIPIGSIPTVPAHPPTRASQIPINADWVLGNTWAWSFSSGHVTVNCTHTDTRGSVWSLY